MVSEKLFEYIALHGPVTKGQHFLAYIFWSSAQGTMIKCGKHDYLLMKINISLLYVHVYASRLSENSFLQHNNNLIDNVFFLPRNAKIN